MIISSQTDVSHLKADLNIYYISVISIIAALGGLLFGYDWVVVGGAKPFYEKYFSLVDPAQQGWAMSCALVGCLIGAMSSGILGDKYGRKYLLIFSAILFAISSIGTGLVHDFNYFVLWRIVGGIAIGLASSLSPMYIAEIAPAQWRGRLVGLNQLTIVLGVLLAQSINWVIADRVIEGATAQEILTSWNGQLGWRWMFGVTAIPSLFFFIGMFFVPESPRWLAQKGETEEARSILTRIGGADYAAAALKEIQVSMLTESKKIQWSEFLQPRTLKVLGLGILLAVFQQWCGINVIFNYAEEIFSAAGYGVSSILFNIIITGAVNVIFTFIALGFVDRWGRRNLMLIGSFSLAIIYVFIGFGYYTHTQGVYLLCLVLLAIGAYAMSLAPIVWVIISEIFPNRIRGAAMSIAVTCLWIACFILTYTFPLLNQALGAAGTFWIYGGICFVGGIFIYFILPETKGKSLEEIESKLFKKN